MGLFSRIGRAISSGAKKAGNTIGRGVEKVGQVIHSRAIENAGFNLQCACDFGYTSWHDSSSVSCTVDVHKELNKVTESIGPSASEAERALIDICISEVGEVLSYFMEITPCSELSRVNENFKSEIQDKLSGQVMKLIQPRLSLDDRECKEILEIRDDAERRQKANAFKNKVLSDAEQKFKLRCTKLKKEYCDKMLNIADVVLASAEAETKKQNELLQQLLAEVTDEKTIDLEREEALITIEKLSILSAIAFDS